MCIDMWRWQSKNPDGYGAVSELAAPRPLLSTLCQTAIIAAQLICVPLELAKVNAAWRI
jgi:hypothetical protein